MASFSDMEQAGQNGFRLLISQMMTNQAEQSRQLAAAAERLTRMEERLEALVKAASNYDARLAVLNSKMDVIVQLEERVADLEERRSRLGEERAELEKELQKNRTIVKTAIITGIFALLTTIVNVLSSIFS